MFIQVFYTPEHVLNVFMLILLSLLVYHIANSISLYKKVQRVKMLQNKSNFKRSYGQLNNDTCLTQKICTIFDVVSEQKSQTKYFNNVIVVANLRNKLIIDIRVATSIISKTHNIMLSRQTICRYCLV